MAYNEDIALAVRQYLTKSKIGFKEKKMFGGLCFMIKDKMACGIVKDELMVRVIDDKYDAALKRPGCRLMDFTGKPMKGFLFVSVDVISNEKELKDWIKLGIEFVEQVP